MSWGELGPRLASDVDDEADGDVFVSAVGPPSVTTKYDTQVVSEGNYAIYQQCRIQMNMLLQLATNLGTCDVEYNSKRQGFARTRRA